MNRTFPAHLPTPTHQIRPEDEGRIHDIAEAEEQAYADAARADLHGSLIAAMLRNPLVSEVDLSDDAEPEGEPADIGDDGVHRASSQAGLAAVRMSLPAVVQMDIAEAKAEGRVLRLALEWEEMRSTLHTVQDVITASEKVVAKTDELIAAIRDYRQAVA